MKPTPVTLQTYRDDPLYPRIVRAVADILAGGKVVAPVDVLVRMGLLEPARLEDWRFGRVASLEQVISANLSRLSRLLRILRFHAHDLNLTASQTAYVKWGKGARTPLRFTKTGDPGLERAYARHFVWPGNGLPPRPTADDPPPRSRSRPSLPTACSSAPSPRWPDR